MGAALSCTYLHSRWVFPWRSSDFNWFPYSTAFPPPPSPGDVVFGPETILSRGGMSGVVYCVPRGIVYKQNGSRKSNTGGGIRRTGG